MPGRRLGRRRGRAGRQWGGGDGRPRLHAEPVVRPEHRALYPAGGPHRVRGGINLYAYAGGDPLTYSDPFGLCPPCYPGVPGIPHPHATLSEQLKGLGILLGVGAAAVGMRAVMPALLGGAAGGSTVAAGAAPAVPKLVEAAREAVSAKESIARGLVQAGGHLARLLPEIEAQAAKINPKNALDAGEVLNRATRNVGLELGSVTSLANGGFQVLSRGNVLTTVGPNGSILIERGKDVLLNLPK